MAHVPADLRQEVIKVLDQPKSSLSQKRSTLLRKGVSRTVVDELEILMEIGMFTYLYFSTYRIVDHCASDEDVDAIISKLERTSPQSLPLLQNAIEEVKSTINFANASGVTRPIFFHPLFMMNSPSPYFKDGVCFEVARRTIRSDILALGGR